LAWRYEGGDLMAVTEATAKAVRDRELGRCQLCNFHEHDPEWWTHDRGPFELHHVKRKGLGGTSDPERDAPENLALLHRDCHAEVHANPREARALGLIESRLGTIRPSALLQRGSA
jgi:hypothetical protein